MSGVRPLTQAEVQQVSAVFSGTLEYRNRALFLMQYYTGRRISQTLALKIKDVLDDKGDVLDSIYYARAITKTKLQGETKVLHPVARAALQLWITDLLHMGFILKDHFLFQARGNANRALTRHAAYDIYKRAFRKAGLTGRLGTHSCRKAFAMIMYEATGYDVRLTAEALGHKSLGSTISYLTANTGKIDKIMLEDF